MNKALAIFRFLVDQEAHGDETVLVTLTGVSGSGARAPGTQMAVSSNGRTAGSFSGGCVEAAVVGEALRILAEGVARSIRFGAGSPFIDIRLPCGGGIDLLFLPRPPIERIQDAAARLEARQPVTLSLSETGTLTVLPFQLIGRTGWDGDNFLVHHDPALRLVVLGHGAEPGAVLELARAYGAEVQLLSPDENCVAEARQSGFEAACLERRGRSKLLQVDPFTAVVTLFHDHDWEIDLLTQALESAPFFVGAMGSRKTHAERCRRLADQDVSPEAISRVVGPIGMIEGARDPETLAISVLAQVVQQYHAVTMTRLRDCRKS